MHLLQLLVLCVNRGVVGSGGRGSSTSVIIIVVSRIIVIDIHTEMGGGSLLVFVLLLLLDLQQLLHAMQPADLEVLLLTHRVSVRSSSGSGSNGGGQ